jgi:hypothetical protein
MSWTVLRGLLPPSLDALGALALIGPPDHHHRLLLDLLLCLPLGLILLYSSIDISSQCLVVLPCLLKFFLD